MNLKGKIILFFVGAIFIAAFWAYPSIRYDFDASPFAYSNKEEEKQYTDLLTKFDDFEEEMVIILKKKSGFRNLSDFSDLSILLNDLNKIQGIDRVTSIQNLKVPEKNTFGIYERPFLDLDPLKFSASFGRITSFPDIREKFLSEDYKVACIYIHDDGSNPQLAEEINTVLQHDTHFDAFYILGGAAQEDEAIRTLRYETIAISILATFLLIGALWIFIRSIRRLLITFTITLLNVALCLLFMALFNIPITVLTAAVPSILAILSFTDQMHIMYHFDLVRKEELTEKALKIKVFKTIGLPLMLTSLANLIGFLIFFVNGGIPQINELAFIASLGIIVSYLVSRLFLPEILLRLTATRPTKTQIYFERISLLSLPKIKTKSEWIIGVFVFISVGCCWYLYQDLQINMQYYSRAEGRMKFEEAAAVYDEHFQGVRDVVVVLKCEEGFWKNENLEIIDGISRFLMTNYGCKTTFSLNTVIKRYERFAANGAPSAYALPLHLDNHYSLKLKKHEDALQLSHVLSKNGEFTRIIGSLPDIGTAKGMIRLHELEAYLSETLPSQITYAVAGKALLFDKGIHRLSTMLLALLVLGMLLVGILIAGLFRSVKIGLITIWVNLLPIGFALVMMLLLDLDLNPSSIFMLTILIGVALDDSIYILGNLYRYKKEKGLNTSAVEKAVNRHSYPLFITSSVLAVAFGALLLSAAYITASFGIIMATSLIFAFLTDVILLPALLFRLVKNQG